MVTETGLHVLALQNMIVMRYNGLNILQPLQNTYVVNNTNKTVCIVDANGVSQIIENTILDADTLNRLGVSQHFKGVILIQSKKIDNKDIHSSAEIFNKKGDVIYDDFSKQIISTLVNNIDAKILFNIYTITYKDLHRNKSYYIRGLNCTVSEYGYQKPSPMSTQADIDNIIDNAGAFYMKVELFSYDDENLYINTFDGVSTIRSTSPKVCEPGLYIITSINGERNKKLVMKNEYHKYGIYETYTEALNNATKEDIMKNKRIDLEYAKIHYDRIKQDNDLIMLDKKFSQDILKMILETDMLIKKYNSNILIERLKVSNAKLLHNINTSKNIFDIFGVLKRFL